MAHPKLSDNVHYVAYGTPAGEYAPGAHRAAIVVVPLPPDAAAGTTGLCVLHPTGISWVHAFQDEVTKKPGTFHYPEQE